MENNLLLDLPSELCLVIFSILPLWQVFVLKFCSQKTREYVFKYYEERIVTQRMIYVGEKTIISETSNITKNNIARVVSEYGDKNILIWIHSQKFEFCVEDIMPIAVKCNHLDIVKWLYNEYENDRRERKGLCEADNTYSIFQYIHHICCANGNITILKWLILDKLQFIDLGINFGICCTVGNIEIMNFLLSLEESFKQPILRGTQKYFRSAILSGKLETVKWLKEKGFQCNYDTYDRCRAVASKEIYEWIEENANPNKPHLFPKNTL